jgi:hypothetical protein
MKLMQGMKKLENNDFIEMRAKFSFGRLDE